MVHCCIFKESSRAQRAFGFLEVLLAGLRICLEIAQPKAAPFYGNCRLLVPDLSEAGLSPSNLLGFQQAVCETNTVPLKHFVLDKQTNSSQMN